MNPADYTILLVDDEQDILEFVSYNLEKEGYNVSTASSGIEALIAVKKITPNLILLDVMMPIKDGFTVAKEIRKINETIPIIFLTAKSMKEDTLENLDDEEALILSDLLDKIR